MPNAIPSAKRRYDLILSILRDMLRQVMGTDLVEIDADRSLIELGADSLLLLQASQRIREKFDVRIPFRSLMEELSTLDAIASYLEPRLPADFAVTPGQAAVPGARPEQNGVHKAKNETAPVLLPSMAPTKTASDPLMAAPSFHQLESARPEEDSAESQMIRADQDDAGLDAVQQIIKQQLQISEQQLRVMSLQLELLRNGNLSYEEVDRSESWRSDPGRQPAPPLNYDPAPPTQAANSASEAVAETLSAPAGTTMKREAFVAHRPINKSSGHGLTERQRQDLDALISRVVKKTQGSRRVAQSVRPYLANNRAVSGFRLLWKEMQYSLIVDRASGSRLWDIDGNEYVDCTMGFGALLFGHSPSFLINAMQRQLERGIQLGAESELAGQAAALICELTGAERVAFCNSGTEAVMSALRLARAVTGRARIALFESCYHGTFDGTMVRGRNGANGQLQTAPLAPGVPEHMIENVLLLKLDDPKSLDILRSQAKTLAAVLVEPMPSRFPDLRPEAFLRELRTITAEAGAALIFDEVVTGFRFHPGGVQSLFGIQADLVAYGKAAGAGIPIGIIAGKSRYMDAIDGGEWNYGDDSYPEAEMTFITGTYFRHPLTMSAVVAVLNEVKALGPELQEALRRRTSRLADTLNAMFEESSFPAQIVNFESLFRFVFSPEMKFADLFYYYLLEKGVYICETRNCLLSSAHTDEDIDFIVQAVRETIAEMRAGDWAPPQEREPASFCPAPSTEAQKELWALSQMGEHISRAYNESYILRLKGRLDPGALRNALQDVVNRHEALRTTFDEEGAVQRIQTAGSIDLQFTDLSLLEGEERERQAGEWCARDVQQVFDLVLGPLLRARIIKLERDSHIVVLVLHHIITDGVSIGIMMQELAALYEAYSGGKSHSLPEPVPFRDYIKWLAELQNSGRMTEAEDFWLSQFADQFPMLDLPADRPRPSLPTYAGAQVQTTLNRSAAEALKNLGARQNCTLFATLLAGYAALLHRLSGRKDMVMGIPVAGQTIMGGGPLLGYCVNFVPFRCSIDGDMRFADFLRSVKKRWLDAYSHSIYPLSGLTKRLGLQRDPARISPIPIGFNLDRSESLDLFGLESEAVFTAPNSSKFDLSLNATETDEGLELCLDYNTDLFEAETVQRWLRHLTALLEASVANPNCRISELQFLSAVERQQLLVDWNRTATDYPRQATLNNLFELGVKAHPERIALVYGDQSLTYHELNARANQLARHLWRRGVGSETLVGICVERSLEMMVGILGILKAGGAYVPMDPAYPAERIAFMLEDAGVRLLLTQQPMLKRLPASRAEVIALDVEWQKIGAESEENPPNRATAENLAYVIYTSGSTGRPKGVLVPHRQVSNFLTAMDVYLRTGPEAVWMAMASISFDMSVLELLWTLARGFRVVVNERRLVEPATRPVEIKNVNGRGATGDEELSIMERMARHQVSHLQCTPSLANILSLEADGLQGINSLQQLLIGGEAFPGGLAENLRELLKAEIHNMYGPTETVVWSAAYPVNRAERTIPVGRPIANNRIYILDERLENVPIGVSGELYIGGEGVVRGYLERAELTVERFLPDAFSPEPGARFYRTGDLARYRKDGQIEFLGRLDDQVKVRGYRIEPGEIEAVCTEHPEVKEAVVLALQRENGGQRLVAYLVAKEGAVLSDSQIRGYLEKRLPDYMVPSAIVLLDEMPINANGKIDRERLPQPELDREKSGGEYRQPATETEQALARIWSEVLQVPRVGTADNFFELGGDSIIAIQISARARQAGLHLTPKDIFERRTIAELAVTIENNARKTTEYGLVTGALPLTPIQRWFFEQHLPEPRHFNQSSLLELKRPLETAVIERALSALITHHDALRSRFVKEPEGWRGFIAEPETGAPLTEIDLSDTPTIELPAAIERRCGEIQASLNLAEGPIIRVGLLRLGQNRGDRLFITIHHLVVDGVSWGILLEDLATACDQASRGEEISLPAKTTSFKRWGELLTELGQKEESEEFWLAKKRKTGGQLPVDHPEGDNCEANAWTVIIELEEEETRKLVHEVQKAYRTQIREVLLAALGTALGEWNGEGKLLVDVEGHGREESAAPEADLTRTVGWFTSIYPVLIEAGGGPGETLKQVKEELRTAPHRGLGYGLVKYLGRTEAAEKLKGLPPAGVSFNYLGQVDHLISGTETFIQAEENAGPERSPRQPRRYPLDVLGQISEGRLRMRWVYSAEVYERATIEAQASNYLKALRGIIAHCLSPDAGGYTPSDFPLAKLDQQRLDELARTERQIEDIYPLSPMQQGILFHCIYEFDPELYFQQCCYTLIGELNLPAFKRAWQQMIDRHPILRTAFVWGRLDNPLQVVGRRATLPFEHHDWRTLSPEAQFAALDTLMRDDRNRGFDLSKAPLMRLRLIQLRDRAFRFIWSFHHILIDGWSMPLILGEVFRYYDAFSQGRELKLEPSRPYQDYIVWLQEQDLAAAERFWRETLRGFSQPTSLGVEYGLERTLAERYAQQEFVIPASVTEELQQLARRHQVTMNTLMQGAWALLLSKYSGDEDVLFGAVVSGRPSDLEGVEGIAGLFINTLPVRVRFSSDARLIPCLEALQSAQIEARRFAYCPLARIQSWSEVDRGRPLFDTIMAFENLPLHSSPDENYGGLEIQGESIYSSTNYPIGLTVDPGPELLIAMGYDRRRFDARTITQIVGHFQTLLANISAHPKSRVSELQLMTAAERERLLVDWNRTTRDYPRQASIASLFELEAEAHPERVALVYGDQSLTYHELNARANQMGRYLRRLGVGPETVVGLCLDRSLEMVIDILAILKAGGAYLPLESQYPEERLSRMVEGSGAEVVIGLNGIEQKFGRSVETLVLRNELVEKIAGESRENLKSEVGGENLAYVIFTSGSTGRPKGIAITQANVARLVKNNDYARFEDEIFLQLATVCFDASIYELWAPLLNGSRLVLYPAERPSLEILGETLKRHQVTTLFLTTALFHLIVEERIDDLRLLNQLIVGGEVASVGRMKRAITELRGCSLINAYGPAESTTYTTCGELREAEQVRQTVPIGKPIANTQVYILDRQLQPAPTTVAGELYIGGDGLAQGYLNHPELTAERFIPLPFGDSVGGRLYRTGDQVRWMEDGQIEFLGRLDHQVKIRGFRIEPEEIEVVCKEHPEVKEALVLARQVENGGKRLVAYLVAKEGAVLSDSQIRGYLEKRLPDYMVPSAIVLLDEMPINANGKIDRGRLPQPELDRERSEREYRQPATETEQALARIWSEVLHVPKVGAADNFFELGGDSILAIQISARARQAELHLTPKNIFECRTIAELAAKIQTSARKTVDQGLVTGALPLTPIQRWFFEQHLPEPRHFNQSSLLELKRPLETAVIERALSALITHHDALRSRFVKEPEGWRGFIAEPETGAPLTEIDLSDTPTSELPAAIERRCGEMQASLNLAEGPIIRVGLLRLGQNRGDRLFITIHHLAVDIASWGILLEDLATACDQTSRGEEISLPAKTISFKRWGELLTELGQKEESEEALDFWLAEKRRSGGDLPMDHADGNNIQASARTVIVELDEEETRRLAHEVPKAYRTQISEVTLAALGTALGEWNGEGKLLVDVEGHGREESTGEGVDLTRTVGWFTSIYPVVVEVGTNPGETLKRVKEEMREGARRGLMYGVLKYLGRAAVAEKIRQLPQAQICFNFMSQFGGQTGEFSVLEGSDSLIGPSQSPEGHRPYLLEINGAIIAGRLRLSWTYSDHVHNRTTIDTLTRRFKKALRSLMDHCVSDRSPLSPTGLSSQQVAKAIESVSF